MTDTAHNLLTDDVFRVRYSDGTEKDITLPAVLESLGRGGLESFSRLQAHQIQSWYCFLVQLAAAGLVVSGDNDPVLSTTEWLDRLLALTHGARDPWCLVVKDLSIPAFMQPPVPEGSLDRFKTVIRQPDELDILVTSKNFDVKCARIGAARPEHWVYAMVSLQTMQGYSGRDNYGVVRMNGGLSNRPFLGYAAGVGWTDRFLRDVRVLLRSREQLVRDYGYRERDGTALLWLLPWDGKSSLPLESCDPFFIEVCRRVRLVYEGGLEARCAPSTVKRLSAAVDKGDTGDPWTPVKAENGEALTLDGSGFTYRRLQRLLFSSEFRPGPAALPQSGDPESMVLVARAMVRGQGKTDGLHQRVVPIPGRAWRLLMEPGGAARISTLAEERVKAVSLADRILNSALCVLLQGAPESTKFDDNRSRRWRDGFDQEVDRVFFPRLWDDVLLEPAAAAKSWAETLRQLAREQLEVAVRAVPSTDVRYYRAVSAAERVLEGGFRKQFPDLFTTVQAEPK